MGREVISRVIEYYNSAVDGYLLSSKSVCPELYVRLHILVWEEVKKYHDYYLSVTH